MLKEFPESSRHLSAAKNQHVYESSRVDVYAGGERRGRRAQARETQTLCWEERSEPKRPIPPAPSADVEEMTTRRAHRWSHSSAGSVAACRFTNRGSS